MFRSTIISILFCIATVSSGIAQELVITPSDSIVKIDGKEYVIHSIQSKQTLFSIAKVYRVKLSSIAFDNPGVMDGIQPGQYLKIDRTLLGETTIIEATEKKLELDGGYILYNVPSKKTLYAISKEYNTTISALLDANPELADGLKVGTTIRVPVQKLLPVTQDAKVEMIGLPDMIKQEAPRIGQMVNVVLMIPFYLDQNDTLEAGFTELQGEQIFDRSEMGLHFYEGVLIALDSLSVLGYEVNIRVIDTENRPWKIQQLIKNGLLSNADLIIGPFYSKVFEAVANFGYQNCIPVVTPTIRSKRVINGNPYVFKVIPSHEKMIAQLGSYLALSDSTNNLIVHYGKADEQLLLWRFRQGLEKTDTNFVAKFPAFNVYKTGKDSLNLMLSLTKRNNVVVLSDNEARVSSLVRSLSDWSMDTYIVAYTPNSWHRFKSLDIDHFDRLRVHMPMPFFVSYESLETQLFVQRFKNTFKTEPNSFAFRGYDIAMHFIQNLDGIKQVGPEYMLGVKDKGLQNDFDWHQSAGNGMENSLARIIDYTNLNLKMATD